MAITVVQHKSTKVLTSASTALAFTSNVTAGNLLIAVVASFGTTTQSTPTDSQSNAYTRRAQENPGTGDEIVSIYSAVAGSTGANTVTAAISPADTIHLHIYEANSVDTFDQPGTNAQASTTAGTVSTGSATTNANELVLAAFAQGNAQSTWTFGTGYTAGETTAATSNDCCFTEYKVVSTTGTQTATATASVSAPISGAIATFYAGSGATIKHYLGLLGVGS
jgi:hypothetical protein